MFVHSTYHAPGRAILFGSTSCVWYVVPEVYIGLETGACHALHDWGEKYLVQREDSASKHRPGISMAIQARMRRLSRTINAPFRCSYIKPFVNKGNAAIKKKTMDHNIGNTKLQPYLLWAGLG